MVYGVDFIYGNNAKQVVSFRQNLIFKSENVFSEVEDAFNFAKIGEGFCRFKKCIDS